MIDTSRGMLSEGSYCIYIYSIYSALGKLDVPNEIWAPWCMAFGRVGQLGSNVESCMPKIDEGWRDAP